MAFNRLIGAALAGATFEVFGDGNQTRDFTFVADAVAGTMAAADRGRPGGVYNIGGGSRRSLNSVLDMLGELMDQPPKCKYRGRQVGDAHDTAADISAAARDLDFAPSFDFYDGLKAQLDWQREAAAIMPSASIGVSEVA
jgi:nucleoside-diphosphate-sugar epimerase